MIRDTKDLTIGPERSMRHAMRAIDQNGLGIILVVDDELTLLGTVTDGDVRRALLAAVPLDRAVEDVMCHNPRVATPQTPPEEVFTLMNAEKLRLVPVVDEEGTLEGVFEFTDLARRFGEVADRVPAVLMAGGLGTRLRPLTNETPKPLLEVGGQPILERLVSHLKGSGVDDMFITTRYMADQIEDHFGDGGRLGVNIDYVREEKRLGTAGALKYLEGKLERPFLVMNGDLITTLNVREMMNFHREHDATLTVAVRHYQFQVPYGVVEVDDVRIREISEKPEYDFFVNAGIYILDPSVLPLIPADCHYDITELIDTVIERGQTVVSFPIHERWMDIGRPEDLERARELFAESADVSQK
jgi:dTDP-glucose pyrophosphorylase